jgi:hypothetical protein
VKKFTAKGEQTQLEVDKVSRRDDDVKGTDELYQHGTFFSFSLPVEYVW